MGRPKRPVWSDDKYKTNADYFGFQDELTEWGDKAEAYMDAQAEIIKGLEVDLEDTRKALPDLKTIALEKAKTIKRLMKAWRVLSQGGCIDPRNRQEQDAVKELDTYLYLETDIDKEENRGPTKPDEPAE